MSSMPGKTRDLRPLATQAPISLEAANTAFQTFKPQLYRDPYVGGSSLKCLAWNNAGTRIACGQADRTIRVWIPEKSDVKFSTEIRAHDRSVEDVYWDPKHADRLASCSSDGYVKIWDTRNKKCIKEIRTGIENLVVRYSTCGQYLAVIQKDNVIVFYSTKSYERLFSHKESDEVYDATWSNSSEVFAVSLGSGNIKIYYFPGEESATLEPIYILRGHRTAANCLKFDPKGHYLAVGSNEGIVSLWDVKEWICIRTFSKAVQPVCSVSISHDGAFLAIGYENGLPIDLVSMEEAVTG